MKTLRVVHLLLAALLLGSVAVAHTADWQAVKALPSGTRIKVKLKRGHGVDHCLLKEVTDDHVSCDEQRPGTQLLSYRRDNVRAIFLNPEPLHHPNGARTAVAGAGVLISALLVGVVAGPVPLAIGGGVLGGTYVLARTFVHGKTVYRSR